MTEKMRSFVKGILLGIVSEARMPEGKEPAEQWETLFEGDVTTVDHGEYGIYTNINKHIIQFNTEDPPDTERIYRLTVDGVPVTQIVGIEEQGHGIYDTYYVGNMALWYNEYDSVDAPDDGTDFCVFATQYSASLGLFYDTFFVSRNTGTYHVKVERLLKDPVAYSYNGKRMPFLPKSGMACILTTETGAARLLYSSRTTYFDYSVEQESFIARKYETNIECFVYNPAQGHTDWVRNTEMDAVLAVDGIYPVSGETLLWSNWEIVWHHSLSLGFNKDIILSATRAMPIFDYKEW